MKTAILFWCYKQPRVCLDRIQLIRKYNPGTPVFVLYGGPLLAAKRFERTLGGVVDDFYVSAMSNRTAGWKWRYGERLILDWFVQQGGKLSWDSVAIVQWDALVLGSISELLPKLNTSYAYFSGTRNLDAAVEAGWGWTKKGGKHRRDFLTFRKRFRHDFPQHQGLLCCHFIFAILPRHFFQWWGNQKHFPKGMLEYSLPTFSRLAGCTMYNRDLGVWWFDTPGAIGSKPINARGIEIKRSFIVQEMARPDGFRIFHPYYRTWNKK